MRFLLLIAIISLFIGFFQACSGSVSSPSQIDTTMFGNNDKVGKYVNTRGFRMYYETYGSGDPLLIIHANNGSINNFSGQIPYFAKSYKVIVADSRSQGKSVDNSDSLSYEMMADDFNALLDTLHIDSCNVIGWSDGGINGLLLAIRHPDKVKKLAITGANLWPDTTAVEPFLYNMIQEYHDSLFRVPQTPKIKHTLKLSLLLSNEPHITLEQLHQVQCPTLVINGDHDIIHPKHALLIADNIPKSYLWIIPGAGHSTPLFHKDEFNEEVDGFFKRPFKEIKGDDQFD